MQIICEQESFENGIDLKNETIDHVKFKTIYNVILSKKNFIFSWEPPQENIKFFFKAITL